MFICEQNNEPILLMDVNWFEWHYRTKTLTWEIYMEDFPNPINYISTLSLFKENKL